MTAYYNEHDPHAAAWLRELISAGHIAPGDVDERSIEDVRPAELLGYTQCHFFAGIGGWSYALRLAGWPDDRPVWTGSCPCQPFSAAGARRGTDDPRHLWPVMRWLVDQCRPVTVFGEQVASKDGRAWLAGVRADLGLLGYAVGPPIYALRASGRRTSDSGCGGLDMPEAAGWPTPAANTYGEDLKKEMERRERLKKKHGNGNGARTTLALAAQMAGWATPTALDGKGAPSRPYNERGGGKKGQRLDSMAVHLVGATASGSHVPTERRGALNPALSRWLMGYPAEWDSCGATAMQSSRRSRRSS